MIVGRRRRREVPAHRRGAGEGRRARRPLARDPLSLVRRRIGLLAVRGSPPTTRRDGDAVPHLRATDRARSGPEVAELARGIPHGPARGLPTALRSSRATTATARRSRTFTGPTPRPSRSSATWSGSRDAPVTALPVTRPELRSGRAPRAARRMREVDWAARRGGVDALIAAACSADRPAGARRLVADAHAGNPLSSRRSSRSLARHDALTEDGETWRMRAGLGRASLCRRRSRRSSRRGSTCFPRPTATPSQEASVIGRRISRRLLRAVASTCRTSGASVDELVEQGFLERCSRTTTAPGRRSTTR